MKRTRLSSKILRKRCKMSSFLLINFPADPGGGGGAGGSNRADEEDNAGGQCQGLGTARYHECLQGDVPGTDQASNSFSVLELFICDLLGQIYIGTKASALIYFSLAYFFFFFFFF